MKITPENKLGALASYLEIEYQQKTNQCKNIINHATEDYHTFQIFNYKKTKQEEDNEVVEKILLKPIVSAEEALIYAEEWNTKTKAKYKSIAVTCNDQEYVDSVDDQLNKHIVEFEVTLEEGIELIQKYKFEIFDYLGFEYNKEETV